MMLRRCVSRRAVCYVQRRCLTTPVTPPNTSTINQTNTQPTYEPSNSWNQSNNQPNYQSGHWPKIVLAAGALGIGYFLYQQKAHAHADDHSLHKPASTEPATPSTSIRQSVTDSFKKIDSANPSAVESKDQSSDISFRIPGLDVLQSALSILLFNETGTPPPIHEPKQVDVMPELKYPIVLVHGFLGYSSLLTNPLNDRPMFEYFGEVREMYEKAGYTVLVPVLPRSYKVENRAKAMQVALGLVATQSDTAATNWDGSQTTQRVTPIEHEDRQDVRAAKADAQTIPRPGNDSSSGSVSVLTNKNLDLSKYRGPFHLVAHSMGGLDSRYLIAHLQPDAETENRILSLTTIGSPHRGSPIADLIVEQVQKNRNLPVFQYSNGILSAPSSRSDSANSSESEQEAIKVEQIVAFIEKMFNIEFKGMLDLTTTAAKQFNKQTLNRPNTQYFSYAGWRKLDPWSPWYLTSKVIDSKEGFNDGLVSVHSAQWGNFQGVLPMDHLEQIGLGVFHNHLPVYREIASTLSEVEKKYGEEQDRLTALREQKGKPSARESQELDNKERRAGARQEQQRHDAEEKIRK